MKRSTTIKLVLGGCLLVPLANCGSQLARSGPTAAGDNPALPLHDASLQSHSDEPQSAPEACRTWTVSFSACVKDQALTEPAFVLCGSSSEVRSIEYPRRCDAAQSLQAVITCCERSASHVGFSEDAFAPDAFAAEAATFDAPVTDASVRRRIPRRIGQGWDASSFDDAGFRHDAAFRPDASSVPRATVPQPVPGRIRGRARTDAGVPARPTDCRPQSVVFDQCVGLHVALYFASAQCASQGLSLEFLDSHSSRVCGVAHSRCCALPHDGGVNAW